LKRFKKIAIWGGLLLYLSVVLGFVVSKFQRAQCNAIEINIIDSAENHFIDKNQILNMVYKSSKYVLGYPMDSINTAKLEEKLKRHPFVKHAEIYKNMNGVLQIELQQRQPIIRIINRNNLSYYIDDEGVIMPVSEQYTSLQIVASGFIKDNFDFSRKNTYQVYSTDKKCLNQTICDLYELIKFINSDSFLSALIGQIYVNQKNEFEIIPRVGSFNIIFGTLDDMNEKFENFKVFYKQGLKKTGWNRYYEINLKYKNQIVCKKRTS